MLNPGGAQSALQDACTFVSLANWLTNRLVVCKAAMNLHCNSKASKQPFPNPTLINIHILYLSSNALTIIKSTLNISYHQQWYVGLTVFFLSLRSAVYPEKLAFYGVCLLVFPLVFLLYFSLCAEANKLINFSWKFLNLCGRWPFFVSMTRPYSDSP